MTAPRESAFAQRAADDAPVPTIEAFGTNRAIPEGAHQRLSRDSPPPYTSSTEAESITELEAAGLHDIQELLDAPLSDEELDGVAKGAAPFYEAGAQLFREYVAELDHLETFSRVYMVDPKLTYLLKYRVTKPRLHILARAAVRRRWQALGLWNDNWGPIYCNRRERDSTKKIVKDAHDQPWAWDWQQEETPHGKTHPVWRAAHLRSGLRRGECPVPPPRKRLTSKSSRSEKEAFITSRPWFQLVLSMEEEFIRLERLSPSQLRRANIQGSIFDIVRTRWRVKGLWKPEWDIRRPHGRPAWKWRHESPSPEPETYLQHGLNIQRELSPMELEEYEGIDPDVPSTPPYRLWWQNWKELAEEEEETPAVAPPEYGKTAAKPKPATEPATKPARKKTAPPRGQTHPATPAKPRRSPRIAALQAKRQKRLANQGKG